MGNSGCSQISWTIRIWNLQGTVFRYADGIAYYRLTKKTITRLAKEAEAIYKIDGKMALVRRDLFESYLRKQMQSY